MAALPEAVVSPVVAASVAGLPFSLLLLGVLLGVLLAELLLLVSLLLLLVFAALPLLLLSLLVLGWLPSSCAPAAGNTACQVAAAVAMALASKARRCTCCTLSAVCVTACCADSWHWSCRL